MEFKLQKFKIQMDVKRIANIHYFEFTNHYSTKSDSHNFCELLYIDRGTLTVNSENFSGTLSVNQLIIHRPNELHSLTTSDLVAPNVIIIGFECSSEALVPFSKNPITLTPDQANVLAKILQEGMSIYKPPYDIPNKAYMPKRDEYPFGADQMIKIGLESLLISLVRMHTLTSGAGGATKSYSSEGIQGVHRYISENFRTKLSLDNLCFLFGFNKTTLCQSFKSAYGITIFNYISNLKIKEAKALLRGKKMSITEISERLGYESVHYFCRSFKKQTGLSPTEYYKMIRSKLDL
ncbi:MAG: AraC family transcriptional regulator [Ruminococcaceae bacterium]|nr:AraC family transcriptional regulator [Oscillospiraceae bacterium]